MLVSMQTVYTDEGHGLAIQTSYAWTFYSGKVQPSQIVTTLPAVPTEQNGSGIPPLVPPTTTTQKFDMLGNLTESTDECGLTNKSVYDIFTRVALASLSLLLMRPRRLDFCLLRLPLPALAAFACRSSSARRE